MSFIISLLMGVVEGLLRLLGWRTSDSRNRASREGEVNRQTLIPARGEPSKGDSEPSRKPMRLPDGSHELPVVAASMPEYGLDRSGVGWVRWHPMNGVTFEIENTGEVTSRREQTGDRQGAGRMREISPLPELTGQVFGLDATIEVFGLSVNNSNTLSIRQGIGTRSQKLTGCAAYASVELPQNHELAFAHESSGPQRLLLADFTIYAWPLREKVEWTIESEYRSSERATLPLSGEPTLTLARSSLLKPAREASWLIFEDEPTDERVPWFRPEACLEAAALLSLLAGKSLPFLMKDRLLEDRRLKRTYFSFPGLDDLENQALGMQPVPLRTTTTALRHGSDVVASLPAMLEKYRKIRKWYEIDWIVGPLWHSLSANLDDKLALACVSLERLAAAYESFREDRANRIGTPKFWTPSESKRIRKALKEALSSFALEKGLNLDVAPMAPFLRSLDEAVKAVGEREESLIDESLLPELRERMADALLQAAKSEGFKLKDSTESILESRIDQFGQPTNRDKLMLVFDYLGIPLSAEEIETIDKRNDSLHGRRTLEDPNDLAKIEEEARRFDVLRTAIHKALLALLGYQGRFIDYTAKPVSGGYPAEILRWGQTESEASAAAQSEPM